MSLNPLAIITPEEAKAAGDKYGERRTLTYWQALATRKPRKCEVCGQPEWKYGRAGMCFSCTTGSTDSRDDYEIGYL